MSSRRSRASFTRSSVATARATGERAAVESEDLSRIADAYKLLLDYTEQMPDSLAKMHQFMTGAHVENQFIREQIERWHKNPKMDVTRGVDDFIKAHGPRARCSTGSRRLTRTGPRTPSAAHVEAVHGAPQAGKRDRQAWGA